MGRTYRAGAAKLFVLIGPALIAVGLAVFGLAFPIWGVASQDLRLLWGLLGVPVFAGSGLVMLVLGLRSRMVLRADAVSWRGMVGTERTVPYAAIRAIQPPVLRGRGPRSVVLHLMDGSAVPLTSLSRAPDEGTTHDPSLDRAVEALQQAHAAWWSAQRR